MDILKVLSRGTKPTSARGNRGNIGNAIPASLPSAGAHANPQLFHDPVGSRGASRKRKRGGEERGNARVDMTDEAGEASEADEEDGEEDDESEVDFFATRDSGKSSETAGEKSEEHKTEKSKSKKKRAEAGENQNKNRNQHETTREAVADRLLDEEACRRILRSHRLKFTLLAGGEETRERREEEEEEDGRKKKKKKSKKQRAAEEAAAAAKKKKDEKKQLFPQPLTAFSQLRHTYHISPRLADNLDRLLYRIPTEVQMGSLPLQLDPVLALSRRGGSGPQLPPSDSVDFLAVAPTGSGKTLSFLVPAIDSVLKRRAREQTQPDDEGDGDNKENKENKESHALHTVVVAPTRELARQIANEGKKLAAGTGVRVVAMRKGMRVPTSEEGGDEDGEGKEEERGQEDEGTSESESEDDDDDDNDKKKTTAGQRKKAATVTKADILVTTPLLLLNFLSRDGQKTQTLPSVQTLVLDEADVLLDELFRAQTLGLWTACTHPQLQTTFWSATMASSMESLAAAQLASRAAASETAARQKHVRPLVRLVVGLKDTAVPNVTHRLVYTATEQGKLLAMRQLLHPTTSVSVTTAGAASLSSSSSSSTGADEALRPPFLVFTQTAERATALHNELKYDIPAPAGGAARLGVLHAALSDSARSAVVRRFRAGEVWVLITTDVLARGIDFAGVNGVVNFDVPGSAASYVHRAGRTGRAGRQGGMAVTLYTKEDIPFVKNVANVIAASERQAQAATPGKGGKEGKGGSSSSTLPSWLLDALPNVTKADKKQLKKHGVASRRTAAAQRHDAKGGKADKGGKGGKDGKPAARSRITSKSAWERRKENNLRDAIASSKRRKLEAAGQASDEEWTGLE